MKAFFLSVFALAVVAFASPNEAEAQRRPANVVDYVARSGGEFDNNPFDFDILVTAVTTADQAAGGALIKALTDPKVRITLFAPNDLAFIRTARDLGFTGSSEKGAWEFLVAALTDIGGGDPIPVLTNILKYHVAPKRINSLGLVTLTFYGQSISTLLDDGAGGSVTIRPHVLNLVDKEPDLPNPKVTIPFDVQTNNGTVHTINRVLIPVDL